MEKKSDQPSVAISWKALPEPLLALVRLAYLSYPNSLASIYALCSPRGNKIYTVDKHDTVISKNRIIDIGSAPRHPLHQDLLCTGHPIRYLTGSITSGYPNGLYRFITRSSLNIPRDALPRLCHAVRHVADKESQCIRFIDQQGELQFVPLLFIPSVQRLHAFPIGKTSMQRSNDGA